MIRSNDNKSAFSLSIRSLLLILMGSLFSQTLLADTSAPSEPIDCVRVERVASLIPPHISAYFGMTGLPHVENIESDLDRTLARLLAEESSLFNWKKVDFDEIVLECQLVWREENIDLFKRIQQRVLHLTPALALIQARFPDMPVQEVGQWLGEGMTPLEIQKWKTAGLSPFAARLVKMRQKGR